MPQHWPHRVTSSASCPPVVPHAEPWTSSPEGPPSRSRCSMMAEESSAWRVAHWACDQLPEALCSYPPPHDVTADPVGGAPFAAAFRPGAAACARTALAQIGRIAPVRWKSAVDDEELRQALRLRAVGANLPHPPIAHDVVTNTPHRRRTSSEGGPGEQHG
eukprot:CAMPEP_0197935438 /NCGR_PEP_ID=MMETSP1439-20131203/113346_1 /TAXON_ID=66791 /ORGANISM="Gonyaulax spinifera, Strain CCMP409" /LENGTH=160 /DNA_ID=CAMNT_0043558379 /DNA_START=81 /DNA_END=560 /DNA_ORIENTATION=+